MSVGGEAAAAVRPNHTTSSPEERVPRGLEKEKANGQETRRVYEVASCSW